MQGGEAQPVRDVGVGADRYQRTGDGWKFTERIYQIRYPDTSPLAGSALRTAGGAR